MRKKKQPPVGYDLATSGLSVQCSTTVLLKHTACKFDTFGHTLLMIILVIQVKKKSNAWSYGMKLEGGNLFAVGKLSLSIEHLRKN